MLDEHRGAFEYDWRTRFQMPATSIGVEMPWGETLRLVKILLMDTTSQVYVALSGWQYALSREGLAIRDLYDLQHRSKSKRKPTPYPRPWDVPPKQIGAGNSVSIAEYEAIKAGMLPTQARDAKGRFIKTD